MIILNLLKHFRLRPRNTSHASVFDRTPEGMAGISAKSAFWLCHSYGVKWPGWPKALSFQRGDLASGMNRRGTTPWGAPPQKNRYEDIVQLWEAHCSTNHFGA
jgi:hypothetical protein